MTIQTSGAVQDAPNEPRTRIALLLESIALRHQIALLERSRTVAVFSAYWSAALDLFVVLVAAMARKPGERPPGNRLALASYRLVGALEISITWSLAPWAPKVFGEVRHLIVWMARENFL
jgi:hypothetical protein